MIKLKFKMNFGTGFVDVPGPLNADAIALTIDWTNDRPSASVQNTDFRWAGTTAQEFNRRKENGTAGFGPGIYVGVPFEIYICLNSSVRVFNGMVDLANTKVKWDCDIITAPSIETGKIDWFQEFAEGFGFDFMRKLPVNSPGRIIPSSDYKKIPYAITEIPDYTQSALLAVSIFLIAKELADAIKRMNQLIGELSGDAATAVATAGLASGTLIAKIASIVLEVAYLFLLIATLVKLVKDLISNLIQSKKYKLGMTCLRHFERVSQRAGKSFSSSIFGPTSDYRDATWLPAKTIIPSPSNPLNIFDRPADEGVNFPNNPENNGYHDGLSVADFLRDMMKTFNAEIKITNSTIFFERKRFWNNTTPWQIPNTSEPGFTFNLPRPYRTNLSELPASLFLHTQVDESERNTTHRYRGSSVKVTLKHNSAVNLQYSRLANGQIVQMPWSHARRKEYLTKIEEILNVIINAVYSFVNAILTIVNAVITAINAVLSLFGGNAPQLGTVPLLPLNILNDRKDWLALSNDTYVIPKLFVGKANGGDWIIHPQSEQRMSMRRILDRFWGIELPTRGAQAWIYEDKVFKFCCDDYLQTIFSNVVKDPEGYNGTLIQSTWQLFNSRAVGVSYKIYRNFDNTLSETIIEDGGQ